MYFIKMRYQTLQKSHIWYLQSDINLLPTALILASNTKTKLRISHIWYLQSDIILSKPVSRFRRMVVFAFARFLWMRRYFGWIFIIPVLCTGLPIFRPSGLFIPSKRNRNFKNRISGISNLQSFFIYHSTTNRFTSRYPSSVSTSIKYIPGDKWRISIPLNPPPPRGRPFIAFSKTTLPETS